MINETCISAGPRISEVLGLQIRHLDLDNGTLRVEQRNWHQDIGKPRRSAGRFSRARAITDFSHLRGRLRLGGFCMFCILKYVFRDTKQPQ